MTKLSKQIGLTSKKGLALPKSAIDQLLKHPAYYGIIRWNGHETLGVHEPLVTKEVWERVQAIREGRGQRNTGYGSMPFTYRGMIRCQCGKVMTGELKKGKYVYYHCTGEKRAECGRHYVSEGKLTEAFTELLKRLTVPTEVLSWMQEGLREADKDRHAQRRIREQAILLEVSNLRKRLEQLYIDKIEGEVTPAFYRETKQSWESRITELQLELAAIDRAEPVSVDEAMRILELASTAHLRFKNADSEQKRELLQFMLSNSAWEDGSSKSSFMNSSI